MKVMLILSALAASSAFAGDKQKAIDHLWSMPQNAVVIDYNDLEAVRNFPAPPTLSNKKLSLGDWIKYHAGEKFKWRVVNQLQPVDGFNFIINLSSCSLKHVAPNGKDLGFEERLVGFTPPVRYGEVAVLESEKQACVNQFACGYEVQIEGLDDPDAKRTFGPYVVQGNTGPLYDCFLEATDRLSDD